MRYLLDHREMKQVDAYSIETIGIPSLVLMERAALAVTTRLRERLEDDSRVLAVSGSGNNGADAVAAARILYNMGYAAEICLAAEGSKISDELRTQLEIAEKLGMKIYMGGETVDFDQFDWLIDGLFGIGLSRAVGGGYADMIRRINQSRASVCAVDIPSGVFADNGQILGCCVRAEMTVTFGYDKIGMVLYPGAQMAGDLYVADIGFARGAAERLQPKVRALDSKDIKTLLPPRLPSSNKGTYGRLLVIAGKKNMCGAALLCGAAAYRMGAGLVRVAAPEENRIIIQSGLPEAVLDTYESGKLGDDWINVLLAWADAVVIGPGLGTGQETLKFLEAVLASDLPAVIDADALNVLSAHREMLSRHRGPVIVTPHLGEMSRLTGRPVAQIQSDLIGTCRSFAAQYRVVCVLKDARTVISDGEDVFINTTGNNGMSTGGSGDVLAGIIGGLLAQTQAGFEDALSGADVSPKLRLAALGAYIHGRSGDEAKKVTGVYGLLASDIIKYLSSAIDHC